MHLLKDDLVVNSDDFLLSLDDFGLIAQELDGPGRGFVQVLVDFLGHS